MMVCRVHRNYDEGNRRRQQVLDGSMTGSFVGSNRRINSQEKWRKNGGNLVVETMENMVELI